MSSGGSRGGSHYRAPEGWTKLALNVKSRYKTQSDWLDKESGWVVAYHGTRAKPEVIKGIIRNGLRIRGGGDKAINGQKYGPGIYCTPTVEYALTYARKDLLDTEDQDVAIVFVCRVRPGKFDRHTTPTGSPIWRIKTEENIRVCALLLRPEW